MTSEFYTDDVLVQFTSQQTVAETPCSISAAPSTSRSQTSVSVAVELGRRLLLAARTGQTATVLELMAKGAPFTTDWLGTSPLHLAAANNHVETCAVLLRAGVSRDARTKVERTPLHMAAHAGNAAVISLLINHGASIDCRDMLQMTPLHWAAARGHAAAARALLRAGAAPRVRCKFRKTPRDLALRNNHPHIVALLDEHEEESAKSAEEAQTELAVMQKVPEVKTTPKKIQQEKMVNIEIKSEAREAGSDIAGASGGGAGAAGGAGTGGGADSEAARLLRRHGITLLPADPAAPGATLLTALQAGRTLVLSDAGKLMLKESSSGRAAARAGAGARPPRALKVMALNNKLGAGDGTKQYQQVKLVQLSDGKVSGTKVVTGKKPVKIVLNKEHFQKLVSASKPANGAAVNMSLPKITIKTEAKESEITHSADVEMVEARPELAAGVGEGQCAGCAALSEALTASRAEVALLRAQLAALQN